MRWVLVLVLCTGCLVDEHCSTFATEDNWYPDVVIANPDRALLTVGRGSPTGTTPYAVTIRADGALGPMFAMPTAQSGAALRLAAGGRSTALFHERTSDGRFRGVLVGDGGLVSELTIPEAIDGHAAVFDGTQYHVFWHSSTTFELWHRTVTEAGAIGGAARIATDVRYSAQLSAASDGAGAILLVATNLNTGTRSWILDDTGAAEGPAAAGNPIYFAGQFHLRRRTELATLEAGGTLRVRPLPAHSNLYVGTSTILIDGITELDANLAVVGTYPIGMRGLGVAAFGAGWIYATTVSSDPRSPVTLQLVIVDRDGERRFDVATGDAPTFEEHCGTRQP